MSLLAVVAIAVGGWWLAQLVIGIVFFLVMASSRVPPPPAAYPRAAVVMPVRGADAVLADAVRSVLEQDYPDFELQVVVDSVADPAWRVVTETVAATQAARRAAGQPPRRVRVEPLAQRLSTCSLVCSSVIQAFDRRDASCGMVAFCASDTVLPKDWLRIQAGALADPAVGATLGNRWYVAGDARLGTAVRVLWNACAVPVMWSGGVPWSGALALRPDDVVRSGLRERWARALVEDVPAEPAIRAIGLRARVVPSLMVANAEGLGLGDAYRFLKRQMLWARLYHPTWPAIVAGATVGAVTLLLPLVAAAWSLVAGRPAEAALALGGLPVYVAALAFLMPLAEAALGRAQPAGREPWPPHAGLTWTRLVLAIPVTQLVYAAAVYACMFTREIEWRGVRYTFDGPWDVRRLGEPGA